MLFRSGSYRRYLKNIHPMISAMEKEPPGCPEPAIEVDRMTNLRAFLTFFFIA